MAKRKLARATPTAKEKRKAKSRWITWAVVGGLVVVIGALIAMLSMRDGGKASGGKARVGSPAPDFTLRLLNGDSVTLSSLKGKPVLINFWAST
ncbi:MAG: redoxin domain-containing protein [candidate division NC10 bacterium]|nr:redoxin domain-containing protein [candidate division NC10 bacterium]